jgi:hypothetical protein
MQPALGDIGPRFGRCCALLTATEFRLERSNLIH